MTEAEVPIRKILIVDFWSDKNRGDAAMQVATVSTLRRMSPGARITVMTAYGYNQAQSASAEFDEVATLVDSFVGGVRPTYFPVGASTDRAPILRKLLHFASLPFAVFLVCMFPSIVRSRLMLRLAPRELRRTADAIRECDVVVWNGRNFRSDSKVREWHEIWQLVANPLACRRKGLRISCVGASVWPLHTRPGLALLRYAFEQIDVLTLREQSSHAYVVGTIQPRGVHVELLPDLSLAALRGTQPRSRGELDRKVAPERVAITVVDWWNDGRASRDQYIRALKDFIGELERKYPSIQISIVPQVTVEMESTTELVQQLVSAGRRISIHRGSPSSSQLAEMYREFDILMATRMHSAIFACFVGIPVVTIPYDAGGKWAILEMMGFQGPSIPYREVAGESLMNAFESAWSRRLQNYDRVQGRLESLDALVDRHMALALDMAEDK